MEKSKLRRPKTVALGPQYRGSRISRDAVSDDEEEDDPFGRGFDDGESEEEIPEEEDANIDSVSSEESEGESEEIGEEEHYVKPRPDQMLPKNEPDARSILALDQKVMASRLVQSAKADAEKGRAVKRQRLAFDSLLSTRIKLQKAMIGANTVVGRSPVDLDDERRNAHRAVEEAEKAAFNLWSTLNDLRDDIIAARAGQKRKQSVLTEDTSTEHLWSHMQQQEESNLPHRNAVIKRWSDKDRATRLQPQQGLLKKSEHQSSIIESLQEHIYNPTRLLKRAHTPRSCAPLQLANNVTEDDNIYDDADFYGLLLKELLEQNSIDNEAVAPNIELNFNLHREAKAKKNVDTKASKGRKLRYTVHEKLQNFMAPEDRRGWDERQSDELFRSLFGRGFDLGERDGENEGMVDGVREDEVLPLFRN